MVGKLWEPAYYNKSQVEEGTEQILHMFLQFICVFGSNH